MSAILTEASAARDDIVRVGRSIFERGLTFGSTGNISVRLSDGTLLLTPTNISLGDLDPGRIAHVDADGRHLAGDPPTKEAFLHRCMYGERPQARAVVHLHSTHAVAASILADVDPDDVLPPLTAYYVMRVGQLPLVPYHPPGDETLALAVKERAGSSHALLLANHGPIVAGNSLADAQYATEELEETAKLFLLLKDRPHRPLSDRQVRALRSR